MLNSRSFFVLRYTDFEISLGGFVGKTCWIETQEQQGAPFKNHQDIYPEDSNKLQSFDISPIKCTSLKIVFQDSTDFYGRITVYQLNIK